MKSVKIMIAIQTLVLIAGGIVLIWLFDIIGLGNPKTLVAYLIGILLIFLIVRFFQVNFLAIDIKLLVDHYKEYEKNFEELSKRLEWHDFTMELVDGEVMYKAKKTRSFTFFGSKLGYKYSKTGLEEYWRNNPYSKLR
ncbi:hypothetical protein [Jeotgalibacillus soli]|uniref:Uncharacterized protein n=1 Tax=Jeotgalibacillus soli TaxID=889306 RepID=A0A0C2RDA9_9BACL|nr:hypothetical protein [Jeotgalibacillus soli]KIL48265.1 hypothetical protein KP78_17120 [Jeotgalibacillus soli]